MTLTIFGTTAAAPVTGLDPAARGADPLAAASLIDRFTGPHGLDAEGLGQFLGGLPPGLREAAVRDVVADPRTGGIDGAVVERASGTRVQLAQAGAVTAEGLGGARAGAVLDMSPATLARIAGALRAGSVVGLATMLTRVPPRPEGLQVASDMFIVANARPGQHQVYLQGTDGLWRNSGIAGTGTPDGRLVIDLDRLGAAYGRPLPDTVLAMAGRPANVPAPLQTTETTLGTAMADAPDPCRDEPGQRHHMIPAQVMERNQRFLTRIGFQLDQPANLIRLPSNEPQRVDMEAMCGETRPIHRGGHTNEYRDAINNKLSEIDGMLQRGEISVGGARDRVNTLMSGIREGLTSGRYANVNDPALAQFVRSISVR